jgi:hypothetical protein
VDDNKSLKQNLSTGAEETATAQLCVIVSGNGNVFPKFTRVLILGVYLACVRQWLLQRL